MLNILRSGDVLTRRLSASVLLFALIFIAPCIVSAGSSENQQLPTNTHPPLNHKPSSEELHKMLTSEQYEVTQKNGTEQPYQNAYWNNHEAGIYVDIVSGEPLFSSLEKYDSGTGWPSFWKPLVKENIVERPDNTLAEARIEVRSKHADSHLGHIFTDGPQPTGLRYCMNSAALKFIPVAKLQESGYGEFLKLFKP